MMKVLLMVLTVLSFSTMAYAQDTDDETDEYWTGEMDDETDDPYYYETEEYTADVYSSASDAVIDGEGAEIATTCEEVRGEASVGFDTASSVMVVDLSDVENPTVDPSFFTESDPELPNPDDTPPPPPLE